MKKTILYTVCLAVLTMTGCDKTVLEFPENGGIDPTLVNAEPDSGDRPENRVLRAVGTLQSVGRPICTTCVGSLRVFRDEIGGDLVEQRVLMLRAGGGRTSYNPYFR